MDRVIAAVEYVFLFTLAAGLVVLYAAIQATQDEPPLRKRRARAPWARAAGGGAAKACWRNSPRWGCWPGY